MPHIQIADDVRIEGESEPAQRIPRAATTQSAYSFSRRRLTASTIADRDDGIINIRSRVPTRQLTRQTTQQDEDPGLRKESDFNHAQVFSGKILFWLAYQSIGVIYGDIGTSPLYVFSSTFTEPPSKEDLDGALSLIIWSLIMMVTVKYIFIILQADNNGEGGTFSTYSLLSRYLNITNRDPREASLIEMKRYMSGDLESAGRRMRHGLESSKFARVLLKVIGVLAVTMVMSDGLLTPAQSVLGAVQGIEVVAPNISKGTIIGVTDAILVVLFALQPLGISRITVVFSPIIIIWLLFNAAFGAYNLAKYDASVFKAFNPGYAFLFLIHHKEQGWRQLGGILLCFTGLEALFADLGAFSRRAIQLSWLGFTFPCILLAYIGQAAYISVHPEAYSNPFFNAAPPGTIYPSLVIAILAAIVASQAIITAFFQLLAQIMKLSFFPQIRVVHTSDTFHGQLYVPIANVLMCIGTILVASIYNNTTSLGNAYGTCVMFVTFFDTIMVSLVAIFVWRFSPWLVLLPFLVFASMDGTFLSSALTKVPEGAWFTITLSAVLASFLLLWRFGKEQQWLAEAEDRFPTSHFIKQNKDGTMSLSDRYTGTIVSSFQGLGIFFDKAGETTPTVFSQFVLKLTAMPEVAIFLHLRPLETPSIGPKNRYTVSRLSIPNCYRVVVRYGFNDMIVTPDLAAVIYGQVRQHLLDEVNQKNDLSEPVAENSPEAKAQAEATTADAALSDKDQMIEVTGPAARAASHSTRKDSSAIVDDDDDSTDPKTVEILDRAYDHKVLYIIGKEQMTIVKGTRYIRTFLLWIFLWVRDNTRNKMANLKVPKEKLIEVGFLKEI